jgi:hypothetical protein
MAFIPEDEDNAQQQGMNVFSEQPQMQQQAQSEQDAQQPTQISSGQAASIEAGQAQTPQQSQQQATGAKDKPKGSGMFTDIRKYVQANKPSAQRIAGAVTGNIERQKEGIRSQVEKQQNIFQKNLQQAQANLQQSQQFAQQAVQQAGTGQLTDEQIKRFRDLATGRERIQTPEAINLTQQQEQARQLQDVLRQTAQDRGRKQLLRQTFGDDNRYTRGQQSLDALLLAGDETARDTIAQQKQAGLQTLSDVQQARRQALQEASQMRYSSDMLGENIGGILSGAEQEFEQNLDQAVEARRQDMLQRQQALQEAISSGTLTEDQLREFLDQDAIDRAVQQRANAIKEYQRQANVDLKNHIETGMDQRNIQQKQLLLGARDYLDLITNQDRSSQRLLAEAENIRSKPFDWVNENIRAGWRLGSDRETIEKLRNLQGIRGTLNLADFVAAEGRGSAASAVRKLADLGYTARDLDEEIRRIGVPEVNEDDFKRYHNQNLYLNSDQFIRARESARANTTQQAISNLLENRAREINPQQLISRFVEEANRQRRMDLNDVINMTGAESIQRADVITPEMIARQQALAKLAGREGAGVQQPSGRTIAPGTVDLFEGLKRLGYYT